MLQDFEKYLEDRNAFKADNLPNVVRGIVKCTNTNLSYKGVLALTVAEAVLFASQFNIKINLWDGASIPINTITFLLAKSGKAKDSTIKLIRKCFKEGYDTVEEARKQAATQQAIKKAAAAGIEDPSNYHSFSPFLNYSPLFVSISTQEGFIQHLNLIEEIGLGAGFMYSGEIGTELQINAELASNIKLIAELYDAGQKEAKMLKDRTNQSKELKNVAVSATFMGSQDNIFDEAIKRKFRMEFSTKLARRSVFIYDDTELPKESYTSVEDFLEKNMQTDTEAADSRKKITEYIGKMTNYIFSQNIEKLEIAEDVKKLFMVYKKYNEDLSQTLPETNKLSILTRAHLQWKALKIAGAFAVLRGSAVIEQDDYAQAISFVEQTATDIIKFEDELNKQPYETFVDYVRARTSNTEQVFVDLHTLQKLGFVTTRNTANALKELTQLASSLDKDNMFIIKEEPIGIEYSRASTEDNLLTVSVVECGGTKEQRKTKCDVGYKAYKVPFTQLGGILKKDFAFAAFEFRDGKRNKDNVMGSTRWVILDVDKGQISDKEAHHMLADINHYIARTSDPENPYKFRILLELDFSVDIPNSKWSRFIKEISRVIGIQCDHLGKAQIYFSYANSPILENLNGSKFPIKDIAEKVLNTEDKQVVLTASQKTACLNNKFDTFTYAYEAKTGAGSRSLIRAAYHAKDLGFSFEETASIIYDINDYWVASMPDERIDAIVQQVKRMFNETNL